MKEQPKKTTEINSFETKLKGRVGFFQVLYQKDKNYEHSKKITTKKDFVKKYYKNNDPEQLGHEELLLSIKILHDGLHEFYKASNELKQYFQYLEHLVDLDEPLDFNHIPHPPHFEFK